MIDNVDLQEGPNQHDTLLGQTQEMQCVNSWEHEVLLSIYKRLLIIGFNRITSMTLLKQSVKWVFPQWRSRNSALISDQLPLLWSTGNNIQPHLKSVSVARPAVSERRFPSFIIPITPIWISTVHFSKRPLVIIRWKKGGIYRIEFDGTGLCCDCY